MIAPRQTPAATASDRGKALLSTLLGPSFLRDPLYLVLLAAGFTAWLLPQPGAALGLGWLAAKAAVEELAFRFGLQETLNVRLGQRQVLPLLGLGNLLASSAFALLHLVSHPPLWALATFVPSLAFGLVWDRHKGLLPCWLLHFAYNALYFYQP
ncbi:MAG: JDVT-CTERM system glutamic-type intramembrane protease [Desulfocurvibacter africanus]